MESSGRKRIIIIVAVLLVLFVSAWIFLVKPAKQPEENGTLKTEQIDDTYKPPESNDTHLHQSTNRLIANYAGGLVYKNKVQEWVAYDGQNKNNLGAYGEGILDISQDAKHFCVVRDGLGVIIDANTKRQIRAFTGTQAVWRNDGNVIILKSNPNNTSTTTVESVDGQVLHTYTGSFGEEIYAIGDNIGLMTYNGFDTLIGTLRITTADGQTVKVMENVEIYNVDSQKRALLLRIDNVLAVIYSDGKTTTIDPALTRLDGDEQTNFALHGDTLQIARSAGEAVQYQSLNIKTGNVSDFGTLYGKQIPTSLSSTQSTPYIAGFDNKVWKILRK